MREMTIQYNNTVYMFLSVGTRVTKNRTLVLGLFV